MPPWRDTSNEDKGTTMDILQILGVVFLLILVALAVGHYMGWTSVRIVIDPNDKA